MALYKDIRVDVPEKGIVLQKANGIEYAYYTVRSYRNSKGKPTSKRVSIGKIEDGTGKLIPNSSYYTDYLKEETPEIRSIKSYGVTYLIECILKELKLDLVLEKKFPEIYTQITAIAEYMLCEGNIMYGYESWTEEVHPYRNVKLNSQQISRVFQGIDYNRRMEFFRTWIYAKEQSEYLVYDVTSISSYSQKIEGLEWGYNRDGEDLKQINLAMYYGEQSQLPLYYCIYYGSLLDKVHLESMLRDNEIIGNKKVKYILDRGFHSEDNIKLLVKSGCRVIMSIPGHLKVSTELIDRYRGEIAGHSECHLGKGLPYAKAVTVNEFGIRCKIHIYYSPSKASIEEENLYEKLEKDEEALKSMKTAPEKNSHYEKHFEIVRNEDKSFEYRRDPKKIDNLINRLGFFLILETDFTLTSEEVLALYRRRDIIEKSFDELKNDLDMRRMYCQSDDTMEGKMFVVFLSLILRSFIHNRTISYFRDTGTPFSALFRELNKMRFVCTADGRKMLSPITKKQRDILNACGYNSEDIPDWLDSIPGLGCIV